MAGRPRWNRAPIRARAAKAALPSRSPALLAATVMPTANWLTRVSQTRDQWGCSGRTFQSLAANVPIGKSTGSSMRVVERVSPELGNPGPSAAAWSARQRTTSTFSTVMASVGQACTQAGANPAPSRGWQRSHLVTMRRSGWNTGTE